MLFSEHLHQQKAEEGPRPETGGKWAEKPEEGLAWGIGSPGSVEGRWEGTGWSLTQGQLTRAGMLFPRGKSGGGVRKGGWQTGHGEGQRTAVRCKKREIPAK